jgi:signal transduction histidine kinase
MPESEIESNDPLKHEAVPVLAHQLRTSLSAMKWILKMFLDGDVGTLTSEQHGFIDKAYSANERMIALVSEMLALVKNRRKWYGTQQRRSKYHQTHG